MAKKIGFAALKKADRVAIATKGGKTRARNARKAKSGK